MKLGPLEICIASIIFAAAQGDADAQSKLGNLYHGGNGVIGDSDGLTRLGWGRQDYAEAMKWYRKAAEQGYAQAQLNLGNIGTTTAMTSFRIRLLRICGATDNSFV